MAGTCPVPQPTPPACHPPACRPTSQPPGPGDPAASTCDNRQACSLQRRAGTSTPGQTGVTVTSELPPRPAPRPTQTAGGSQPRPPRARPGPRGKLLKRAHRQVSYRPPQPAPPPSSDCTPRPSQGQWSQPGTPGPWGREGGAASSFNPGESSGSQAGECRALPVPQEPGSLEAPSRGRGRRELQRPCAFTSKRLRRAGPSFSPPLSPSQAPRGPLPTPHPGLPAPPASHTTAAASPGRPARGAQSTDADQAPEAQATGKPLPQGSPSPRGRFQWGDRQDTGGMHAPRGAPGEGGSRLCHRREGSRRHRTGARRSGVLPGTAPPFSAPGRDPRGTKLGVPRPSWGAEASRRRPAGPVWTCKCVVGRGGAFRGGGGPRGPSLLFSRPVASCREAPAGVAGQTALLGTVRPSRPWSAAPLRGPRLLPAGKCPVNREGRGGEKQVLFTSRDLTTPLATAPPLTLPATVTTTPMAARAAHIATHGH